MSDRNLECFLGSQHSSLVNLSVVQAWGLLEAEGGNLGKARELLEKGSQMDPWHVPIWQAWGVLEFRSGNIDRARALFQEVGVAEAETSKNSMTCFHVHTTLCMHGATRL